MVDTGIDGGKKIVPDLQDAMAGTSSKQSGRRQSLPQSFISSSSSMENGKAIPARSATVSGNLSSRLSISSLRFEKVDLVGRESELAVLKDALHRIQDASSSPHRKRMFNLEKGEDESGGKNDSPTFVRDSGDVKGPGAEMIVVSGRAGTGKTTLVSELRRLRQSRRGSSIQFISRGTSGGSGKCCLFASGKFDQAMAGIMSHQVPFGAFSAAFEQLVIELIDLRRSDPDAFSYILDKVRSAVPGKAERRALQSVIPNLTLILDYDEDEVSQKDHEEKIGRHAEEEEVEEGKADAPRFGASSQRSFASSNTASCSLSMSALGNGADTGGFDGGRARNAFYFLVRRFVQAVASRADNYPVVLVIDDLQWADNCSLGLLQNLATDREMMGVLFVGCHRDEESTESLEGCFDEIRKCGALPLTSIHVTNLKVEAVNELLGQIMSGSKTSDLALVVHKKTGGNAFFVRQFVLSLYDQEFLNYNLCTLTWQYDVDLIRSETSIADNVVDLMTDKIVTKLSQEARDILQMAACLGGTFDLKIIVFIYTALKAKETNRSGGELQSVKGKTEGDVGANEIVNILELCVEEGLLESVYVADDNDKAQDCFVNKRYRFSHDHIRIASYLLMPDHERTLLQVHMGEVLVSELSSEDLDDAIFVAVDLLNRGSEFIPPTAESKSLKLAKSNLQAGKKAMKASAFSPAIVYLRTGIDVLRSLSGNDTNKCHWDSHRSLSLELFGAAIDAEFCCGNLEEMHRYIDEVLAQPSLTFNDKLRAYSTHVRSLGAQNQLLEAIDASLFLLCQMGVHFPKKNQQLAVLISLMKTERLLGRFDQDALVELPIMEDNEMVIAMRIMDNLLSYAYAVNQDLFVLVTLKLVRRSVKYGVCQYSPCAFAAYGNIAASVFGDLKTGHGYAKLAQSLYKRLDVKKMEARVLFITNNFVLHWNDPLQLSFKPYLQGYQSGMETGDLENAMFCITSHCDVAMHTGRPLSMVASDFQTYTQQMKDFELEYNYQITRVPWQLALNLMGECEDPVVLTGHAMDQGEMLKEMGAIVPFVRSLTNVARMWLAYYFGDYDLAWEMVGATKDLPKTNLGQSVVWRCALFEGLTVFALARKTGNRKWQRRGLYVMKRVKKWASKGNLNCVHILYLLEAEQTSLLEGHEEEIRKKYDQAISVAGRNGFSNDKALSNERAGEYFVSVGGASASFWARHYMKSAYQLYTDWEAWGKAGQLKENYPELVADIGGTTKTSSSSHM
jgi:predicted ATPase